MSMALRNGSIWREGHTGPGRHASVCPVSGTRFGGADHAGGDQSPRAVFPASPRLSGRAARPAHATGPHPAAASRVGPAPALFSQRI